jgi:flagellar hook-length control protein FliK
MSAATAGIASGDTDSADDEDSSSSPPDDLATPAVGTAVEGASSPVGVPAIAAAAADPAAVAAAAAGANAELVTTLVNPAGAGKHALGGTGDALSGTAGNGVAGGAQLSVNASSTTDAAPTPTLKVAAGVDTPEFGQGVADRVTWMVDNSLNGAKLQVNPPQLGPIEVRIAVQGDQAQVWLTAHSTVTRDALESSAPKLREMLGSQGFGQVSVDISQRSFQDRSPQPSPYEWTPSAKSAESTTAVQSIAGASTRTASGALDAYA